MIHHTLGKPKPTHSHNVYQIPDKKITQEELNELIKNCKFNVGDVVAYHSAARDPVNTGGCDIVIEIINDVNKIEYQYQSGIPRFIRVMSCYVGEFVGGNTTPFNRLSTENDLKKISGYHYNKLIVPIYDKLQNRIQQLKKTLSTTAETC
jgi:hypothetical protein